MFVSFIDYPEYSRIPNGLGRVLKWTEQVFKQSHPNRKGDWCIVALNALHFFLHLRSHSQAIFNVTVLVKLVSTLTLGWPRRNLFQVMWFRMVSGLYRIDWELGYIATHQNMLNVLNILFKRPPTKDTCLPCVASWQILTTLNFLPCWKWSWDWDVYCSHRC